MKGGSFNKEPPFLLKIMDRGEMISMTSGFIPLKSTSDLYIHYKHHQKMQKSISNRRT
ncbi:hypothetical protein PEPS_30850 (plasmid) [Persicobacter psychrovividus]|uniref:Uncharacterized protein n=1 Tax=Persicobacter psychrovividus TaxID=387638 RepID=A0ABM7VJ37_9BACT|nr:hypothetical protein PEPS_30850 [Persicobacter psychrovividus]